MDRITQLQDAIDQVFILCLAANRRWPRSSTQHCTTSTQTTTLSRSTRTPLSPTPKVTRPTTIANDISQTRFP